MLIHLGLQVKELYLDLMERYLWDLSFITALTYCWVMVSCNVVCLKEERDALVGFKDELYPSPRFSSWNGLNCCEWRGVECSRETSHVIKLHLSNYSQYSVDYHEDYLTNGILSPALFKLKHLEHLDLRANYLSGVLPTELFDLHRLKHLDLSFNYFQGQNLKHISSLHSLSYLNLSCAGPDLDGSIEWHQGNLSQLQALDLSSRIFFEGESYFQIYDCGPLFSSTLEWTAHVRELKHLSLQGVKLNMTGEQLEAPLSLLHNLHHLNLKECGLSGHIPNALQNLTSLSHLQLGWNHFTSLLPKWLGNLTALVSIEFDYCDLTGPFPPSLSGLPHLKELKSVRNKVTGNIGQILLCEAWPQLTKFTLSHSNVTGSLPPCIANLSSLQYLDLAGNSLNGQIPASVGFLSALVYFRLSRNALTGNVPPELGGISTLEVLFLDNNQLNGTIPNSLGYLSQLSQLNLEANNLEGCISLQFFENATRLAELYLSGTKLTVHIEPDWIPPMQFVELGLGSCNIGGPIPAFLSTQYSLWYLDLSNNSLFGNIPAWFNDLSTLIYLDLSVNNLQGEFPSTFDISYYEQIYLGDNMLTGSLPIPSMGASYLDILDLSQNRFTGFIPVEIASLLPAIEFLLYSQNDLRGDIPASIGLLQNLQDLDLSGNSFEGEIPSSITNCSDLKRLNLANNKLSGEIPSKIGSLSQLEKLHLSDNMLEGNLPSGLQNCWKLQILDVANNSLSGNIPLWLGQLPELMILVLRSNSFKGWIPHVLGNLSSLHVLDISHNNLTGAIPPELGRFEAIISGQPGESNVLNGHQSIDGRRYYYKEEVNVSNKKLNLAYEDSVLLLITAIDLSSNQLSGEIPSEIGNLKHLHVLNFSGNSLTGEIPLSFGSLEQLESLDLSNNKLHGRLPGEMVQLSFLTFFIVSNNKLCGRIPTGRQFSTFNSTYFSGNPGLCGFPIDKRSCNCEHNSSAGLPPVSQEEDGEEEEEEEIPWYWYVSWMASFAAGFWGVFSVLFLKKKWRIIYIRVLDGYVAGVVNILSVRK